MNRFLAKVRLKEEETAAYLIEAFFQNFNPESSIVLKEDEVKIEVFFESPPDELIEAIEQCEVIELYCGKFLEEHEDNENVKLKSDDDLKPQASAGEILNETKLPEVQEKPEKRRSEPNDFPHIPELEAIAQKATSFDNFVTLVAQWIQIGKRQDFFKNMVIASTEVDVVTWKNIENVLNRKKIVFKQYDKLFSSNKISEKMKKYSITLIPFLDILRKYKDYPFNQEKETSVGENVSQAVNQAPIQNLEEKISDESIISKPRIKMECMPEIQEFEETLVSIDKTQAISERVRYVLKAIGLSKLPADQQRQIIEVASIAVKSNEMNLESIFNAYGGEYGETRMQFSKLINDYVKTHGGNEKVKILTFLSELQKVIMLENE